MVYDDYVGWVDKKQLQPITDEEIKKIKNLSPIVSADLVQIAIWNKNQICPVVIGSSLRLKLKLATVRVDIAYRRYANRQVAAGNRC